MKKILKPILASSIVILLSVVTFQVPEAIAGPFGSRGATIIDTQETNDQFEPIATCVYHFFRNECRL